MFTAWARVQADGRVPPGVGAAGRGVVAPGAAKDESRDEGTSGRYIVSNKYLTTSSRGLRFRASPNDSDKVVHLKPVPFGSYVQGRPHGDAWLAVGRHFLPMTLNGVPVLFREPSEELPPENPLTNPDLPIWMCRHDYGDEAEPGRQVRAPPRKHAPPEQPMVAALRLAGDGALHLVVSERLRVRKRPSTDALVENIKSQWSIIELFDADDSGEWRLCLEASHEFGHPGWVMLAHPELGRLVVPLDPVCDAAAEGRADELRDLLQGLRLHEWPATAQRHPLRDAAARGSLACCAHLLHAGIDAEVLIHGGALEFPWELSPANIRVLLNKLAGDLDFESDDLRELAAALPSRPMAELERLTSTSFCVASGSRSPGCSREFDERFHPQDVAANALSAEAPRGTLHRIVHKSVWVRSQPRDDAEGIAVRRHGDVVELLEADVSGQWRQLAPTPSEPRGRGWLRLVHPLLGELLEPLTSGEGPSARDDGGQRRPLTTATSTPEGRDDPCPFLDDISEPDDGDPDSWDKFFARR